MTSDLMSINQMTPEKNTCPFNVHDCSSILFHKNKVKIEIYFLWNAKKDTIETSLTQNWLQ